MGERTRAGLLVAVLATAWWLADIGGAAASHGWTTLAVREVHAYRHVLEPDDRLILARYALVERPGESETAYGPTGAMLRVQDGDAVLRQAHPPFTGYGLAAFYWAAADADLQAPWAGASIQVCFHGSPTLLDPPQSHCDSSTNRPDWNDQDDLEATAAELGDDVKELLAAMEADDPDVASGQYVGPSGITPAGRDRIDASFPHAAFVAPEVFAISQETATGSFTNTSSSIPDPTALAIPGPDSAFSVDLANLGAVFGIPFLVMGLGMVVVLAMGMYQAIAYSRGDRRALLLYPIHILLAGGMIGVPPFMAVIGILVLAAIASFAVLVNRFVPG